MADPADPPTTRRVSLSVMHGEATPQELAAVIAVLTAAAAADGNADPAPRHTEWASPRRRLRAPVNPGPDAWRGSGRPC